MVIISDEAVAAAMAALENYAPNIIDVYGLEGVTVRSVVRDVLAAAVRGDMDRYIKATQSVESPASTDTTSVKHDA
jgi:hypothetical protein